VNTLNYESMTKLQKAAAFMILIGAESAAELLKHFNDAETDSIVCEMAKLPMIDHSSQRALMEEFTILITDGHVSALGGIPYTLHALELAKGAQAAAHILQRAVPPSSSIDGVRELSAMEPRQIFNLIKSEQPQTIAFIVSYLDTPKAAEVMPLLPDEARAEVVQRIADMEPTPTELVSKVMRNLNKHTGEKKQQALHRHGGAEAAAHLLNRLESGTGKSILLKIEERNPALGGAIRRKMFTFDDFVRVSPSDMQRILRGVETRDMALALKSSGEPVKSAIFGAMSKRAADGLREEMEVLGAVRLKEVEAARDRMIATARVLEQEGEISLAAEEADAVVD
jgi:flagellar motor switch protein FliG